MPCSLTGWKRLVLTCSPEKIGWVATSFWICEGSEIAPGTTAWRATRLWVRPPPTSLPVVPTEMSWEATYTSTSSSLCWT
jgi:hypothetical protein